jgi:hypothetical protein
MRTLIIVLAVLALHLTSIAQTEDQKNDLSKNAPETCARLKFYWPDELLEKTLPDLPGETCEKRVFVFALANVESEGFINKINRKGSANTNPDCGILQIKQISLDDYWQNTGISPYCLVTDLADPTKPDSVTKVLPLKILNDMAKNYGLKTFHDIAYRWHLGTRWRELAPSSDYFGKVLYSYEQIELLQNTGRLAAYNKPPDEY